MLRIITFLFFFASFGTLSVEMPVENFVKHGDYLEMELSPDGKHISAYIRNEEDLFSLLDTATMQVGRWC